VPSPWAAFEEDLARRRDAGRPALFWWRDDDAAGPTPEISRLLELSRAAEVPLALAVVPQAAQAALFRLLHARVAVLQHGGDHHNRAGPGEKKTEFPAAEREEEALARIAAGRERLESLAGTWLMPVFAPPWNRLRGALAARLPQLGLRGLSTFGPRPPQPPAPALVQVNTHVDIVAWHAGRGFIGEEQALAIARRQLDALSGEPTGWLTHHAVHDAACWAFLERLFEVTRRAGGSWAHPQSVFVPAAG